MRRLAIISIIIIAFLALWYNHAQSYQVESLIGAGPVLQVYQGGTGAQSFTSGQCLVGNGTGAITTQACGAGGGGGIFSTTTLTAYTDTYNAVIIGGTATTTDVNFEIIGSSAFDDVTLTNETGSTQCLQVDSNGLISGTGSACGTGGSINLLSDIGDVSTSTLADNYILKYDTNTDTWYSTSTVTTYYYEQATSTAGQTQFDLSTVSYTAGQNGLKVYVNGVFQIEDDSYIATSGDSVVFKSGLNENDRVAFIVDGGSINTGSGSSLTEEEVEDYAGGMLGGTETGIAVTYQDATNDIDFVVDSGYLTEAEYIATTTHDNLSITESQISDFSSSDYLSLSVWYSTTTDSLSEGSNNLWFTDQRVADYINGSSTLYKSEADLTSDLDDNYEVQLNNEAGLYAVLSDVTQFYEAGDEDTIAGSISAGALTNDSIIDADIDDDGNFAFTGKWDFGGGDLEVPNGASVADPNAAGEVAIDTTSDQFLYYGSAQRVLFHEYDRSLWIASSTKDGNSNTFETATGTWEIWHPHKAVTLTDLYCETDTGTAGTVLLQCGDGTNWTETIVCDSDGQEDDGSIANGTFTAREDFQCRLGSDAASPDECTITATFTITAD